MIRACSAVPFSVLPQDFHDKKIGKLKVRMIDVALINLEMGECVRTVTPAELKL